MERNLVHIHQRLFHTLDSGSRLSDWRDMVCAVTHCIFYLSLFCPPSVTILYCVLYIHSSQIVCLIEQIRRYCFLLVIITCFLTCLWCGVVEGRLFVNF